MPSGDPCPRPMLLTGCDLRPWAGLNVFDRGATHVSLGSFASAGEGLFTDVLDALGSRESGWSGNAGADQYSDLRNEIDAAWSAAGLGATVWTVGIDAADRVYVESSAENFHIRGPALGFSAVDYTPTVGVGPYRATGPDEWARGPVLITSVGYGAGYVKLQDVPVTTSITADRWRRLAQSVPAWLRVEDFGDADSPAWETVAQSDRAALADASITWGIDSTGRAYSSWWSGGFAGAATLAWVDTEFRDRLGFTGAEVSVRYAGIYTLTADRPCPGVVAPSRPLAEPLTRWRDDLTAASRSMAGAMSWVDHSGQLGWLVQVFLDGLYDEGDDLWDHYLRLWLPYSTDYASVALDIGDTRRRGVLATGDGYSLLYTVEDDGLHGRILGRHAPGRESRVELSAQLRMYRRAPVSLRIVEVV